VLVVMLAFRSSSRLATAYGFAVTGTFLITTVLFLMVAAAGWHWARWKLIVTGTVFGTVELLYFAANVSKIHNGGWLPLLIAIIVITVMTTWQAGRRTVTARRIELEGPLQRFVDDLHRRKLTRVPGIAVFPHPTKETTPIAMRATVEFNHVLHQHVVVISVLSMSVPHVAPEERIVVDQLRYPDDGIVHIQARFGFHDEQDLPATLRQAVGMTPELEFDPEQASYFLSRLSLQRSDRPGMMRWRKRLFIGLAHNAANPAERFHLPTERTVVVGAHLEL
jgi:KUP system potassium uptake protein